VKSDRTPIAAAIASLLVLALVNQKITPGGIPHVSQHHWDLVLQAALFVCGMMVGLRIGNFATLERIKRIRVARFCA